MDSVKIKIPEKCLFLLTEKWRYKVLVGGRGSSKSVSVALSLLILGMKSRQRILCTRQIQGSIKDSVHKLLSDLIAEYKLDTFYNITQDSIRGLNGTEFIFKGLKSNTAEIKSTQGINIAWVEEATDVTSESWDILIPTIREKDSEIWITFNPNMKTDATYQRFVVNPPENCKTVELNYVDNPFFPDVLREEMEYVKKLNYPKYEHIWLGKPNAEAGNLIKMSMFKRFETPPDTYNGMFITCDTAFSEKKSADNSAFLLGGVKGKDKYILDVYCKKVTFVDLQRDLKEFYQRAVQRFGRLNHIDAIYIENKASGISLIQQLRAEGLPIMELTPTVHNETLKKDIVADKYTRFLEVEADLASGNVWLPVQAPWLPEFEKECEAFTGGKQDEKDDVCLIAGTKIKTLWGDKNIEDIKAGEYVITPFGLRKVQASGMTGIKKIIYNKELDLSGTPNHKILTFTSGYTNLSEAKIKECMKWSLKNLIIWKIKSLLCSMGANIAVWGERDTIFYLMKAQTQKEKIRRVCTLQYGNTTITKKYLKAMLFTIKTVIHTITVLTIWSVYHVANIWRCISLSVKHTAEALKALRIWQKSDRLQKNGTAVQMAENGTGNTQKKLQNQKRKQESAQIADASLKRIICQNGKIVSMMADGVLDVMSDTGSDYTADFNEVKLPVYNLTVNGGIYFANNILVSNCDSLIYFLKTSKKYTGTDWRAFKNAFRV